MSPAEVDNGTRLALIEHSLTQVKSTLTDQNKALAEIATILERSETFRRDLEIIRSTVLNAITTRDQLWKEHNTETAVFRDKLDDWKHGVNKWLWVATGGGAVITFLFGYFMVALGTALNHATDDREAIKTSIQQQHDATVSRFQTDELLIESKTGQPAVR